ncbi:dTMP kinase [Marinomonas mediterranea]|uniref:Thymidylate kinase n=1 Tax=Marinomonas mediterranea (strain ATCC 700492 / JCM 21426 / NBRC 103028 / MMB-1) TaxID=717774 RepID=F2JTL9_MARM1|nr:dTMP kinase [Marinomonas mediterranea]ADZ91533.1 Thymidylate kinase [Marinomonas mediterranea MMB-1]WCN17638.1 dTMP kinase [Marinomonas mediterranea MMB-1]
MKGKFITLEGGEGSGKSTAIACLEQWMKAQGIPYLLTREPGGTPLAEEIRQVVLSKRDETVNSITELLLVFAARAQHVAQKIAPALESGVWVISDRFIDSSYVYQGVARGLDIEDIDSLVRLAVGASLPDKTILLDVPVSVGMARVSARTGNDRLDGESTQFHEMVRAGFLDLAKRDSHRISIVDASVPQENVFEQIVTILEQVKQAK